MRILPQETNRQIHAVGSLAATPKGDKNFTKFFASLFAQLSLNWGSAADCFQGLERVL